MKPEIKETQRAVNILLSIDKYSWIQYSRVSWRKKSNYRKAIKRRTSKMIRRELKALDYEYTNS